MDANLLVLLLVAGSFLAFRDERKDRRDAEAARGKSESDYVELRRLYDGLVARGVGEMWSRRSPATDTEEPEDEPTISTTLQIGGAHTSTDQASPRSRRKSRRDPPDQPPLPVQNPRRERGLGAVGQGNGSGARQHGWNSAGLRFAAITVLLIFGGGLFGATRYEAYVVGIGIGLAIVWLYSLAARYNDDAGTSSQSNSITDPARPLASPKSGGPVDSRRD